MFSRDTRATHQLDERMCRLWVLFLGVALAVNSSSASTTAPVSGAFRYVSPVPGSDRVSRWNNIAIREGSALDPAMLDVRRLTVVGAQSGAHAGRLQLTSDGLTLLFSPDQPYALGETVHVRLAAGTRTLAGAVLPELAFEFRVASVDPRLVPRPVTEWLPEPPARSPWWSEPRVSTQAAPGACDTLLPAFPVIQLAIPVAPNPGAYFIAPFPLGPSGRADFAILDDLGQPLYEASYVGGFGLPADFKMQPNGRLTFWMNGANKFIEMDSSYARVDSFTTGNGYAPDVHDLQLLPNGHALMLSYDPEPVSMDTVVAGGQWATVVGLIVQELDENKSVVFQWRSWDHFKITDCSVSSLVNLLGTYIDYVHGNSVEQCPDGNLVISCRHMNEITKIDRQTGDVIWRMGLHAVNNQFSFPNDSRGWSAQHDARILPNGHLTLFDNGNDLTPLYSRALEFALDEQSLVATKVWEYQHVPEVSGLFMGNVQRHGDGSTTIGWGGTSNPPAMTDLHADGLVASEIRLPPGRVNYRAFRFPWRTNRILSELEELDTSSPAVGVRWGSLLKVWNNWDHPITIDCLRTMDETLFGATLLNGSLPLTLGPGDATVVQVSYTPATENPTDSRLYIVQKDNSELVAQSVVLHGHMGGSAGVSPGSGPGITTAARPNPVRTGTNIEFSLPMSGHVTLDVFDVAGRPVATLVDETRAAGRNVVAWSPTGLRGGLYFYRVRAAGRTLVRRLVVAQ